MSVKMIEIFGRQIFGSCADAWIEMCKEQKREWILKYTEQRNEQAIDEFINNPAISKDCKCKDCGKNKQNGNITSGVSAQIEQSTESVDHGGAGSSDSVKRPKRAKKG